MKFARQFGEDWKSMVASAKLHHFIQAAFGWSDSHLHQFKLRDKIYTTPSPDDELEVNDERKASI